MRAVSDELGRGEMLLASLAAIALVLLTADVAMGGLATYLDDEVMANVGASGNGNDTVSGLGELGLSGGILIVVVLISTQATWQAWPALTSIGTVGSGLLLMFVLKAAVGRAAPYDVEVPDGYPGFYPSGHTTTAGLCLGTACFVLLTWRGGTVRGHSPSAVGIAVGLAAATAVGTATVLNGYHWPSDAVAGVLITAVVLPLGFASCRAATRFATARAGREERG